MKATVYTGLLAALTYPTVVLAGLTHNQTGPYFLRVSISKDKALDGQYLIPLVVDSEIVGLYFRPWKPSKEEATFYFDYTVTDGRPSKSGLLTHWPQQHDGYGRRLWHTMSLEQVQGSNLAVPAFNVSRKHIAYLLLLLS
ncbi:hypothetical protein N656DRAFT_580961 [Canariomyces notabilis]|uniref:Uncharacterized protein n=1 Tax=Canariomyces notabilis TaxID=2074819 RepID=A0AAN6TI31_9PEZI|nr:hypothetical protein N656DRAFT_580961 [Canariomyces arenarius]